MSMWCRSPTLGLTASTSYYYRVVATNASGASAPSAVVSATTDAPPPPPPPAAPGGVSAVAVSASEIDVGWLDVAGESGYQVERSANGVSGWTQVGTAGADVVSFSDTGLGRVDQLLLPGVCDQCQWCLGAVGSGQRNHRCPATPAAAGDTGWGVGGGGVGVGD